ncbi:MAG: transcriptional repressor [Elusimicrobia bacterium]|nr:transcriptional repressor [Elusimicrobiota bacterium]
MDRIQTDMRTALAAQGQRWTRAREVVLAFLEGERMPVSAKEVFKKVRLTGINLASIYRSMDLFLEKGVVDCVDSPGGVRRYELSDRFRPHHHHVVCRECGSTQDVAGCGVKGLEERAAQSTGFKILSHQFTFVGLCPDCV